MANRITEKHLDNLVNQVNKLTNNPETYMSMVGDKRLINVGHFHINGAYGGVQFVQTVNTSGGIRTVIHSGFVPKRELYEKISAFIAGLECGK